MYCGSNHALKTSLVNHLKYTNVLTVISLYRWFYFFIIFCTFQVFLNKQLLLLIPLPHPLKKPIPVQMPIPVQAVSGDSHGGQRLWESTSVVPQAQRPSYIISTPQLQESIFSSYVRFLLNVQTLFPVPILAKAWDLTSKINQPSGQHRAELRQIKLLHSLTQKANHSFMFCSNKNHLNHRAQGEKYTIFPFSSF